jgi:hypothetical protein
MKFGQLLAISLALSGCASPWPVRFKVMNAVDGQPVFGARVQLFTQRIEPWSLLFPEPPYTLADTKWTDRKGEVLFLATAYGHFTIKPPGEVEFLLEGQGSNIWWRFDDIGNLIGDLRVEGIDISVPIRFGQIAPSSQPAKSNRPTPVEQG